MHCGDLLVFAQHYVNFPSSPDCLRITRHLTEYCCYFDDHGLVHPVASSLRMPVSTWLGSLSASTPHYNVERRTRREIAISSAVTSTPSHQCLFTWHRNHLSCVRRRDGLGILTLKIQKSCSWRKVCDIEKPSNSPLKRARNKLIQLMVTYCLFLVHKHFRSHSYKKLCSSSTSITVWVQMRDRKGRRQTFSAKIDSGLNGTI